MTQWKLDLNKSEHAYFFGFIQTDGNFSKNTQNRGKLQIELSVEDRHILEKFQKIIPYFSSLKERTRDTNFKENYTSAILGVYNLNFREELLANGLNYGKKSDNLNIPSNCLEKDYFRGIIDGDGSLGFTKKGFPFVSLCTASEDLAKAFEFYLFKFTGKRKKLKRNKRDEVFNITITKEDAQKISKELYYNGCLALDRKVKLAQKIDQWIRPKSMRIVNKKNWTSDQDDIVLTNTPEVAAAKLGRTLSSVKTRFWRLKKKVN